jgi:hypothetical protein
MRTRFLHDNLPLLARGGAALRYVPQKGVLFLVLLSELVDGEINILPFNDIMRILGPPIGSSPEMTPALPDSPRIARHPADSKVRVIANEPCCPRRQAGTCEANLF